MKKTAAGSISFISKIHLFSLTLFIHLFTSKVTTGWSLRSSFVEDRQSPSEDSSRPCQSIHELHFSGIRDNTSTPDETKFLDSGLTPWRRHTAASVWWCNFFPLQTTRATSQILLIRTWTPGGTLTLLVTPLAVEHLVNWAGLLVHGQDRCVRVVCTNIAALQRLYKTFHSMRMLKLLLNGY